MLHGDAQHFFSSRRTRGIKCKESRKQEESKGRCCRTVLLHCAKTFSVFRKKNKIN